jgi:hypothetical protein
MTAVRGLLPAAALWLASAPTQAGIVFTPHLSEYARLPAGQYTEATLIFTEIEHIYDEDGNKIQIGRPFVSAGASTDAALALLKYLWVGNVFRDTNVWYLKDHPQFCRAIGVLGYQQNTEQVGDRTRVFGAKAGGNGPGDLFGLCGIYGDEHRWGPLQFNGLLATTVKAPVGRYDTDAVLNIGTNYWSVIPQFAFHAKLFDRLWLDGTFAYQFNGDNDTPSFLGLTPTDIANWRNYEINAAWKFSEHWFVDVGYGYRESVGSNRYEKLFITNEEPVNAEDGCRNLGLDTAGPQCNATNGFYVRSQPGTYTDKGIDGTLLTAGIYYIYRTSSVFQLRIAKPIDGRGSQITVPFDVYPAVADGNGGYEPDYTQRITVSTSKQFGVQEAAAVSASPFLELRFVYLFWAP